MHHELDDFTEHMERYRAVTLQALSLVSHDTLNWRPGHDYYSLGQQFVHIAQAEAFHAHGIFENEWDTERVRLPQHCGSRDSIALFFEQVRGYTRSRLRNLDPHDLDRILDIPGMSGEWSVRSWLWFILEHELHHKGQIWLYLRLLGITPPFYAMPLEPGERPDIAAREQLGGF